MIRPIRSKEKSRRFQLRPEAAFAHEAEQVLHLKQLLVTLKQHYETSLHELHIQLQGEQSQRSAIQRELDNMRAQWAASQKLHEEELEALASQQITLKNLLKKTQEEFTQVSSQKADFQRINAEKEQFHQELEQTQKKLKLLEQELIESKQYAQKEGQHSQQLLAEEQEHPLETIVSQTSSHQLLRELEVIKRYLAQDSQKMNTLESRYLEVLNEKVGLEHQYKQLQQQVEQQASNLSSLHTQLHQLNEQKHDLEMILQAKQQEWNEKDQHNRELQKCLRDLEEKGRIQDRYEQLKEEWQELSEQLEEAVEARLQAEEHLIQLESVAVNQENQLQELTQKLERFEQDKQAAEEERERCKALVEETEAHLKIAQQHLAKKVKETTLLGEKIEEQQAKLAEVLQEVEHQKMQIAQLQASVDFYQGQEKRLQEQLHDALRGNESQIAKWEEKYFRMYDKWQESETKIRELKKFEEKHLQMQSLLSNLGNFMGSSFNTSMGQELRPLPLDSASLNENSSIQPEFQEERYDLFGMRRSKEHYQSNFFS